MQLIDGRALRDKILQKLKKEVTDKDLKPLLAIILVGDNEASLRYIRQKQKACEEIGAGSQLVQLPVDTSQTELVSQIEILNADKKVTGIIVQLPLPEHLDKEKIIPTIAQEKDIDGLSEGSDFQPATPLGIMEMLHEYQVPIKGKAAVVLGRSPLVGQPVKGMLEAEGAQVIQVHSQTPKPIEPLVQQGDIVISAVGKRPKLVTANMVKPGAVVIDVGTNLDAESGKIVGDVDFEPVSQKASLISPVPGGVGPMTVAMLLSNLVKASKN